LRLALVVFGAAFLVRLVYLLEFSRSVFFEIPILDAAWHAGWARRIADGHWLDGAPYFRAPLYTWFLALVDAVAGSNPWGPRLTQAALGAAGAAFTALTAERLRPRAGLAAGLVVALYGPLVFATGELLHEALLVPILSAWLFVTVRAAGDRDDPDAPSLPWFGSGLLLGLAAIARPSALALAPLLVALPLVPVRRTRFVLPILAGLALPIAPVTLINYVTSGDVIPIASQGGINFYAGNNGAADGRHVVIPELADLGGWEDFEPRVEAIAEQAAGRPLGPAGVSDWWADRGWSWIRDHPGAAAGLWLSKVGALLSGYEVPNNRDILAARADSLLLAVLVGRAGPFFWPWGLLLPLAVLGVAASPDRRRYPLPVAAALLYGASLVPFFVCDRFRLPMVAFLAIPAGAGLLAIPALARAGWPGRAPALLAAGLALLLTLPTWGVDTRVNAAESWHRLGEALYNAGRPIAALDAFNEAVRRRPDDESLRLGRSWAIVASADSLVRAGRPAEAAALDSLAGVELSRVAERLPAAWQAQYGYGHWLAVHGRGAEAVPFLERAAGAQPSRAEVHAELGFAYEAAGRWREAGIALNHALSLGAETAEVHLSLGLAALSGGRPDMAENNWRRALELDPDHARSLYNLGQLEARRGRLEAAADLWRRALRVEPGNELIRNQLTALEAANSAGAPR
jgi:tetratricopeptide (TPR) repeat protein